MFLKYIRSLLGENGVFVFKTLSYQKISVKAMKGMYIGDIYAPVIVLNRDEDHTKRASIFTLAHEVAHLFLDDSKVESVSFRNGFNTKNKSETFCNEVAANFLLPTKYLEEKEYNVDDIKTIAKKFSVSNLVVFYRLKNLGYINSRKATEIKAVLDKEYKNSENHKSKKEKKSGGSYPNNMRDSNGYLFNNFISNLYFEGKITPFQAEKMLEISIRKL